MEILSTRITPPRLGSHVILRQQLLSSLDDAIATGKWLFTITAPAGSGKTTLMTQCARHLEEQGNKIAWLSLTQVDSVDDFMSYLKAGINAGLAESGNRSDKLPKLSQKTPYEEGITAIINLINDQANDLYLFIDDFHISKNLDIRKAIQFLLNNRPQSLRVFICGRTKTPLPLVKYNLENGLHQIDHSELCLNLDEAKSLFEKRGFTLSENEISSLLDKTEGWPALLHVVLLSLTDGENIKKAIENVSNWSNSIDEFIASEIVNRIPEKIRHSLIKISIVDRFCDSLGNAITRQSKLCLNLEKVEEIHFLFQKQGTDSDWYVLQPMLRASLARELERSFPDQTPKLHKRAANWFQQYGLLREAFDHALYSGDEDLIVELLEEKCLDILFSGNLANFLESFAKIPSHLLNRSQETLLHLATVSNVKRQLDDTTRIVTLIKSNLKKQNKTDEVALLKTEIVEGMRDLIASRFKLVKHWLNRHPKEKVLELLHGDPYWRDSWHILQISCYIHDNQYQEALEYLNQHIEKTASIFNAPLKIYETGFRSPIHLRQCQFSAAKEVIDAAMADITQTVGEHTQLIEILNNTLGVFYYYQGDTKRARKIITQNLEATYQFSSSDNVVESVLSLCRLHVGEGDFPSALAVIQRALKYTEQYNLLETESAFVAEAVRVNIAADETSQADSIFQNWLLKCKKLATEIDLQDAQRHIDNWNAFASARIALSRGQHKQALNTLEKLTDELRRCSQTIRLVEALLLSAKCETALNSDNAATQLVSDALELDKEQKFIQLFRDEGPVVTQLLKRLLDKLRSQDLGEKRLLQQQQICAILDMESREKKTTAQGTAPVFTSEEIKGKLLGELTPREIATLKELVKGYSNKEIAENLFISLATVKTHLWSAYSKLGVQQRTQAVRVLLDYGFDPNRN